MHINSILQNIHTQIFAYNIRFIGLELCSGTLEDYVKGKFNTGPKFKSEREVLHQVSKGLAHLHQLTIVHRDIKPTNILIFVPVEYGTEPLAGRF